MNIRNISANQIVIWSALLLGLLVAVMVGSAVGSSDMRLFAVASGAFYGARSVFHGGDFFLHIVFRNARTALETQARNARLLDIF